MASTHSTVAWFSFFPVEWLPDAPEEVKRLPRLHPASWQRVLLDQLATEASLRLHVIVLRKQFERSFKFERNGVTFHLLKIPGGVRATSFFWVDTVLIRRVLRQIRPDVVHAWGTEQGAALVANRLGYPRVVTVQGLMNWYGQIARQSLPERVAAYVENYSLARSPLVTTESRFSVEWLRREHPGLRVEQIEHAPDPVFHRIERQPMIGKLRFLVIGPLDFRKGGDVLFAALDRLKAELDFEVVMVGRLKEDVAAKVRASTSEELWRRVELRENLTREQIAEELRRATMMICASRADVSPNSVKEAVVAGVPVIGSAVGGIPDYVLAERNGVLYAPGEVEALMKAVRQACVHPLFRSGNVEARTLAEMRDYLSPGRMGRRFMEVYNSVRPSVGVNKQ